MNTIKAVALAAAVASASASAAGLNGRSITNATTSGVVYTTEVVTVLTTYCPAATTFMVGNKTYAVTTATMLTITDCPCTIRKPAPPQPTSALPGQDECAKKCNEEYSACRTAPDANMSFCASKLADCVHYNPFGGNGTFVAPTACSAQPTGGNPTGTGSPPTGTAPAPPSQEECAKKCNEEYSACRTAPDANMSCASKLADCVHYNPFGGNGTFVAPTACSAQPTGGNPTGTATGTGTGNATATGTPPPTGAAGQLTPALALLALCALALL